MGNILNRSRRVAVYGRVSTEHEAQVNAMENQKAWYEDVAKQHPEWVIVGHYFDEGITGTAAKKRPAFMNMLADAHLHKFDLIITREVCRFARNVVDALTATRDLEQIGVEVYFRSLAAHELGQFIVYDFYHQLAGLNGCQHVLSQGFFLNGIGEVFGYLIVHVGIQKCLTYVFQGFRNIDFGDLSFTFQNFKRPFQSFA